MINFDRLIFGYFVVTVSESDISTVMNRMIKAGINQKIDKKGRLYIPYRKLNEYVKLLSGIEYNLSDAKGFLGIILRLSKHWGVLAAIPFVTVITIVLLNTVWDIRIEGCTESLSNEVVAELNKAGVKVGSFWFNIDKRSVENKILRTSDDVSWISINRRGTVAYVSVIARDSHALPEKPNGYASLIADRDCIIEEITVKTGYPMVKIGDSVRKGDVLISGVLPQSLGGGYCYAEGGVKGRYNTEVESCIDSEITKKQYIDESICAFSVKIFGLSINIFKNYGKMPTNYDIINKNKEFIFLGKKIPLSFEYKVAREYLEEVTVLDYGSMVKAASTELSRIIAEDFSNEDLLSIKTDACDVSGGYKITARLIFRAEVTQVKEFEYVSEKK